jgi:hypothetical protein
MRTVDVNSINAGDASQATLTGTAVNVSFCKLMSCKVLGAGGATVGVLKLQGSNDPVSGAIPVAPTNWVDLTSRTVNVTAAGYFDIATFDNATNWVRAFYTKTSGTGTITAQIHAIGD